MSLLPTTKPVAEAPLASPVSNWRPADFRNARLRERDAGPPALEIELLDRSRRPATLDELRGYLSENAEEFLTAYRNLSTPNADTLGNAPPYVVAMGSDWVSHWQNETEWNARRFIELLCKGLAPLDPYERRAKLDKLAARTRELVGDEVAEEEMAEDGKPLPGAPVTLEWAMECASNLILETSDSKQALSVAIRMLQATRRRWDEPGFETANLNAMVCAVPIITGLLHLAEYPGFTAPSNDPMVPVPDFGDHLTPSLVDAYLAWRRVKTILDWTYDSSANLPVGDEFDSLSSFQDAIIDLEQKLRDAVTQHPGQHISDTLLKLRCRLEYDDEPYRDAGVADDLIRLTSLVLIPEPKVAENPRTDDECRDFVTAKPRAIRLLSPATLLHLFTPDEGSEVFALATAYFAAMATASPDRDKVLQSFSAYGLYAAWHGGYRTPAEGYVPGTILTDEERQELGQLGYLSATTIDRLTRATDARRAEDEEKQKRTKAEQKAQQAAAEREKHGPPTSERLIPFLPSFSDNAREASSSLLHDASMILTMQGIFAEHATKLQPDELETVRQLDLSAIGERFRAGTQDVLKTEIDRFLAVRQPHTAA